MKRDILPGLFLLLSFPTVWSQCHNSPLSLSVSHPVSISLPSDAIEKGVYKHNLHCEWELSSNREGLQLEFVTFDLQWSPDCIYDYLEIYTGSGDNEQRIDRWCGSDYPNYIVMSSGRIIFRSDDRSAAAGFNIRVKFTTSSAFQNVQFSISLTEKTLLFYAPFYGQGGERLSFDWKLSTSHPDNVIQIDFHSVCENNLDTVQIIQYNPEFTEPKSSDLLYYVCNRPFHDVVVSNIPHVLVRVRTDQSSNNKRFRLAISAVKNYTSECVGNGLVNTVTVTRNPHYLLVPYWQDTQAQSLVKSCQWHVTTSLADHVVAMEMVVYDPPPESMCSDTHITVNNGADNSSMRVVTACANSDRFSSLQSPEMFISVHIHQQKPEHMSRRKAFLMKLYAVKMCEEDGLRSLVAKNHHSYAVLDYNKGPVCTWRVKTNDNPELKMVDVGVLTPGGAAVYNPVSHCLVNNETYLQVFKAWTTLPQHQVSATCPMMNAQDYRVYGTSLYLPTHPTVDMPRPSLPVYYYATRGSCLTEGVVTLEARLETQSLFSPNYPNLFWPHEHCRWRIHSFDPYYGVAFRVLSFTSEESTVTTCTDSRNHITFFDGSSYSYPPKVMRCAGMGTDWITSKGRYIFAEFKSFYDTGGKFEILYKAARSDSSCDKQFEALPTPQNLSSPGYPSGADSNADCWWRITVQSENDVIYVRVLDTDMHETMVFGNCGDNYVEAYDGKDSSEGLIIRWCGTQTPEFISTGKYMFIKYKTSSHDSNKGFLLSFNSTKATITRCGSPLKAFDYVSYLTSPNYPDNYKNHMDCEWLITTSNMYHTVKIEVLDTHLEYDCSFDNVSVYDGTSAAGDLLQTFCAQMRPTLQSTMRNMFIRFQSDSSRTHKGFRLKYYQTDDDPPPLVCNKQLSVGSEARYLESPGYPNLYPSNLNCWWVITANDPSGRVLIEVLLSGLEYSYGCTRDYVSVHDGDSTGRELGRFCGTQNPSYTSSKRSIYILFKTDTDKNEMGFRLKYITTKACVLGHVTELAARIFPDYIESPEYPGNYPNDVSCMWRLTTNISKYIQLTVLQSDIESSDSCGYDYMAAYDGYTDSSPSLGKWCGARTPQFTSSGTVMFIKFRSDGSGTGKGFRIKYAGINTSSYDSSSSGLKAGTVAGVVCGVFVVTAIMIAIVFIIVRHKHKQLQNSGDEPRRRSRRSRRNWRLQQYQERGPWEVNEVFYSQRSADGLVSPPPYSMVVASQLPNEPPPPYPAAEFNVSLKDDDEPAPPYEMENTQNERNVELRVNLEGLDPGPSERTSDPNWKEGNSEGAAQDVPAQQGDHPASRAEPRQQPVPQPRPQSRQQLRSNPPERRRLDETNRAVSMDNLMPGHQPLSLAPSTSEFSQQHMSPQARAVSVGNLVLADTHQSRGYDRQVSQSEMVLNRDSAPLSRYEAARGDTYRNHLSERHERATHRGRPERPERQRDRERGRRSRTRSEPDFAESCAGDDRIQAGHQDRTSPPAVTDRYIRNYKRNPNDNQSRHRGRRSAVRSEFEDMKQRSRSCDNLTSDRLSPASGQDHNPRWSVASEGYMNNSWSTSPTRPLGAEMFNNPRMSLAAESDRRDRVPSAPRPVPRERNVSRSRPGERAMGRSRENLTQGNTSKSCSDMPRPRYTGSRGDLSVVGSDRHPELEDVSGYARNGESVVLNKEQDIDNGQPTETSV